ncbi:MAG: hypothetical protein Q4D02_00465 [Clostridia bacterium]|nr:hypothetical protein [Clostridia bacterium]
MIDNMNSRQTNDLNNNTTSPSNMPESLTNSIYTPGFLRNYIGRLMKVEFLIGTSGLQDRIGILLEVGASYIVLRSVQDNNLLYCDIFSIKFVTISSQSFIYNSNYQYGISTI